MLVLFFSSVLLESPGVVRSLKRYVLVKRKCRSTLSTLMTRPRSPISRWRHNQTVIRQTRKNLTTMINSSSRASETQTSLQKSSPITLPPPKAKIQEMVSEKASQIYQNFTANVNVSFQKIIQKFVMCYSKIKVTIICWFNKFHSLK